MGGLLGQSGKLAAKGDIAEIAVNPPVVEVDSDFQVVINLPVGTKEIHATVMICKVDIDPASASYGSESLFEEKNICYIGPEIDHLAVVLNAPKYKGAYRVGFASQQGAAVVAMTTLLVQDT